MSAQFWPWSYGHSLPPRRADDSDGDVPAGQPTAAGLAAPLALLIGLFAGAVTAAAAGARRTDGAYPELLRYSKAPDVLMFSFGGAGSSTFADVPPAKFIARPQVAQGAALTGYTVANPADVSLIAPMDGGIPGVFWHRKLLAGRLLTRAGADEVNVSFTVAQLHHVRVGGMLPLTLLSQRGGPLVHVRLRVVGFDAAPSEFPARISPALALRAE